MNCEVDCSGINACSGVEVVCPETGGCDVDCPGINACSNIQVTCPETVGCGVVCGGLNACVGGEVTCGAKACEASCPGASSSIEVVCGESCDCSGGC
ncbi:MAG: hypothetical protein EA397_10385 [Deltaproteobacteria bacterium]|nr:MAG: hypothetical protein EA397_10385 [Deltaproteobacteria bacterium]